MAQISIIIPVLNEAKTIEKTLLNVQYESNVEIIVIDGGSVDDTVAIAKNYTTNVISSPLPGRANQMNTGAKVATAEILLFLHADTLLPFNYTSIIDQVLNKKNIIAGAFNLKIDGEMRSLRFIEKMVKWRSHFFSLPYGDQAIFLRKSTFDEIGGFPNLPIMEDFELIRKLKQKGKIAIAPASVLTSSRRWEKLGVVKTTLINQIIIIGYFLGISPYKLRQFYQKKK